MTVLKELIPLFESLVGESQQNFISHEFLNISLFEKDDVIGYSQFNEILLLLGFDRVSDDFFQFLVKNEIDFESESLSIDSVEMLQDGIERFIKLALLFYGNIKFAFKELSSNESILYDRLEFLKPISDIEYKKRHNPVFEIDDIEADKTYYLGYLIEDKIKEELKKNPENKVYKDISQERKEYVEKGKKNQTAYLASDNLDIYVATSMRLEHEFIFVNQIITDIFNSQPLKELKLRYFDPTQAYCDDRIDKGLSEALMLKRAKCTLYLAQESDTLGKDSELASTLAQGKPVIAFVPRADESYVDELIRNLKKFRSSDDERLIILDQIRIFNPNLAWENEKVIKWISDPLNSDHLEMKLFFYNLVKDHYNRRAKTLKDNHPLGIQVNLHSGVANGVLVVRTIDDCIRLLRAILLNSLKFDVKKEVVNDKETIYLEEKISKSIFRLKSGNILLTNSFWNFYI
jgi:hypothetical protein